MKKIFWGIILFSFIIVTACNSAKKENKEVTVQEAAKMLDDGALLLDVRDLEELIEISFHVKSLKHIPLIEIKSRMNEIPKEQKVILACRSGKRSREAFNILNSNGFNNVYNMIGGMNEWQKTGLPVKTGTGLALL